VQRELLLGKLNVDLEHHLKPGQPLPLGCVQAAELCLVGAPQLYGQVGGVRMFGIEIPVFGCSAVVLGLS
jgi:hypothetical protein